MNGDSKVKINDILFILYAIYESTQLNEQQEMAVDIDYDNDWDEGIFLVCKK